MTEISDDIKIQLKEVSELGVSIGYAIANERNHNAKDLGYLVASLDNLATTLATIQSWIKGSAPPKRPAKAPRRVGERSW
jgi:hypothetical protein